MLPAALAAMAVACGGDSTSAPAPAPAAAPAPVVNETPVRRPTPQLDTTADLSGVSAQGGIARLIVRLTLPPDLHVQANKPRDPALIPTEVTLGDMGGTSLVDITYPEPIDFNQAGAAQPLAVYPNVFDIVIRVRVPAGVTDAQVGATVRYQACNDVLCFAPARADATWMLSVPRG